MSKALRAEFARGDGRIKRKEDDRRKNIKPSETLFVVNFHEETTKREDLQMLFEPFGELVRIDMKKNYAFVQYTTTDHATRAKEATDGGKLDQSVITVEFVANRMGGHDRRRRDLGDRGDRGGYQRDRGPYNRGGPYSDNRGSWRSDRYHHDRDRDRMDTRGRDDRYDDRGGLSRRDRSPPRDFYSRRNRSRSRSRSPPLYRHKSRSPSPVRRDDYRAARSSNSSGYDDHHRGSLSGRARSNERDYRENTRARSNEREYRGDARGYK